MASAEKLLHEAQYAFQSISFGISRDNTRNAARAKSLCMKIIRKYPTTMEAGEAHAILRRLGEEAYSSRLKQVHRHTSQAAHHAKSPPVTTPSSRNDLRVVPGSGTGGETLDWAGLITMILALPKALLAAIVFAGIFLFGLFGPFLFLPLILLVLFTGPFRQTMKKNQREQLDAFIARINEHVAGQRG
jgi:hypothetical protein